MHKTYSRVLITALLLMVFSSYANATIEINWYEGDYTIPYQVPHPGWDGAKLLNIYNDVTVTMPGGGGVGGQFNMYDNSSLALHLGYIGELNLYDNASAELYGGMIDKLCIGCILTAKGDWIADPESTAQVTLYARDVVFWPRTPPPAGYSGVLQGYWLANNEPFHIGLYGPDTYSRITIVPEPASITFIALGGLALLRKRSR
ncbi:MAG: hypothetical protein WDA68_09985 [Phycisphaerae bacterium]